MKIWRCDYFDNDLGCLVSWHPTRAKARSFLHKQRMERWAEAKRRAEVTGDSPIRFKDFIDHEGRTASIEAVDVPTTKKALIAWLNTHLNTDNG